MNRYIFLLLTIGLLGCRVWALPTATPSPATRTAAPTPTALAVPTAVPSPILIPTAERPTTAPSPTVAALLFPPPAAPHPAFARAEATTAEQETLAALLANRPPARHDATLAQVYRGLSAEPLPTAVPVPAPLPLLAQQPFVINNYDLNVNRTVTADLLAISTHAYFWFDQTPGNAQPTAEQLQEMATGFDEIYEQVIFYFGAEARPGIDGDPRVHIFNASPVTLCDVTVETAFFCGLLGYFSSGDGLPTAVNPQSNSREMFVMNGEQFGSSLYLEVLAHEFRHMIEDNYDPSDWDWEVEGSAMLAEDLLGHSADAHGRANAFLANPDQQLNRWTDGDSAPYYGQGYLLNRYIYDRLGTDLYREFAQHPADGLDAVTAVADTHALGFTGEELWLDWLVAQAIHTAPNVPALYQLPAGVNTAAATRFTTFPASQADTVRQYAADYYELVGEGQVMLTFEGSSHVPLLEVEALSGRQMWLANRANSSMATLTRAFDLSRVATATLHYAVYHQIENGYDFAYVSVSADGGQTWQGLEATHMQGEAAEDDPSQSAFLPRFYTGDSGGWVEEQIDLTPFVGHPILLRFEYVTDPVLTFGGFALDNVAIPEIGFVDDVEQEQGWEASGFVRATSYVPQMWQVQLVTFVDGQPQVELIPLSANHTANIAVPLTDAGGGHPQLIIAATAPHTLLPARYELKVVAVE